MGDELLTLATTGGRLRRAVRQPIAAFLAELDGGPHDCRLGGGPMNAADTSSPGPSLNSFILAVVPAGASR